MRIIKQLLFIAGMLGLLGIYIRDYIDEAMIDEGYSLNEDAHNFCAWHSGVGPFECNYLTQET